MEKVNFLEENEFHIKSRRLLGEPTTPTMVTILLKTGIAKNEKQALAILLGLVAVTLSLTCWLIYIRLSPPSSSNLIFDKAGNAYTFEQYINLVRQGKDPLLPK